MIEDTIRQIVREEVAAILGEREEGRRWMNVKEAAAYLGVSERAVRARIERGGLPVARLGGRVLIDGAELDRLLERLP